eukprot:2157161-Alexandrium_andersonii.AAC.1
MVRVVTWKAGRLSGACAIKTGGPSKWVKWTQGSGRTGPMADGIQCMFTTIFGRGLVPDGIQR